MQFIKVNELDKSVVEELGLSSFLMLSSYYNEYYKEKFSEESFVILDQGIAQVIVFCSVLDNQVTLPDGACKINFLKNLSGKIQKKIIKSILLYLSEIAERKSCKNIVIKDVLNDDSSLSVLGQELFNQKFYTRLTFEMEVGHEDFSPQSFYTKIRDRYKSRVNWGKKNLRIVTVNKDELCKETFQDFKSFHKKISGRQTRSNETWESQYKMIQAGFGEALLAYYEEKLVSASLFIDVYRTSLYFTGVYERELFQHGISHYPVFEGICRSFKRGNTNLFSLGYFDTNIQDPKWYNTQFFKKGFARNLKPVIFWLKEKPSGDFFEKGFVLGSEE